MYTHEQKINEAAKLIHSSAIEFLANKYNLDSWVVYHAVKQGTDFTQQYKRLCLAGIEEAVRLAETGQIGI